MMKLLSFATIAVMALSGFALTAQTAHADDNTVPLRYDADKVAKITKAYAFATAPVQKNGAAFFTIENIGCDQVRDGKLMIHSAKSDIAQTVELHNHTMRDGVMEMRQVKSIIAQCDETVTLSPHGYHVMLMGLKAPLAIGESFPLDVCMTNAGLVSYGCMAIDVEIVAPGTTPEGMTDTATDTHEDHSNHQHHGEH